MCLPWWLQFKWCDYPSLLAARKNEDSITLRELLPIALACAVWGPYWKMYSVVVHCDNLGTVAVVNSCYSKVPAIMHLLRCFLFDQDVSEQFTFPENVIHWLTRCHAITWLFFFHRFQQQYRAALQFLRLCVLCCSTNPTGPRFVGPSCSAIVFRRLSSINQTQLPVGD